MTDTLKSWVTRIDKEEMPVFQASVSSIAHIASQEESSASELASTILRDPSLSAKILKFANSQFYRSSASGVINTVSHAVVVLGFKIIRELSLSLSIIDSLLAKDPRKNLARLLAKSFLAAVHSRTLAKEMGHNDLEEIFIAALLHDIGEMSFWCIASDKEVENYEKALQDKSPEQAQLSALGFHFRDLTCQLVKKWNIHNVLEEVLQDDDLSSENARIIHFGKEMATIDISAKQSKEDIRKIKEIAKFVHLEHPELKTLLKKSVKLATETANAYSPVIIDYFPGKDGSQSQYTDEDHGIISRFPEPDPLLLLQILRELSTMLHKSSDINIIIEALLEGIHRGVGMDRCLFAMFDSHKSLIAAKFVLGSTAGFLKDHFFFPVGSDPDNLFAHLFDHKKGIWIQNTRITPYSKDIMYQIRTTLNVESFFITPIIVNRRPIGIFYADRQPSKRPLDEDSFASFEHLGQQAGISIDYISHK